MNEPTAIIVAIIPIIVDIIIFKKSMSKRIIIEWHHIPTTNEKTYLKNKGGKKEKETRNALLVISLFGMLFPISVIIYIFLIRPELDKTTIFLAMISFFAMAFSATTYQNILNISLISNIVSLINKTIEEQKSQTSAIHKILESQSLLADRVSKIENSE